MSGRPAKRPAAAATSPQPGRAELLRRLGELEAENARLHELSLIDELTGLHNYRYFLEQLDIEMERVRRTGAPCSLLMMDIDLFKRINDGHGHEAGNAVLKACAATIKAGTRAMDIACRYGGEEFAVILPATSLEGAVRIAERIRKTMRRRSISYGSEQLQVTLSAGAACYRFADKTARAELIELADAALYRAKKGGRDQVCQAPEAAVATEVSPAEKELLGK